jgi:hypothetical protein
LHARPHEFALVGEGEGMAVTVTGRFRKGGFWRLEAHDGAGGILEIDVPVDADAPLPGASIRIAPRGGRRFAAAV